MKPQKKWLKRRIQSSPSKQKSNLSAFLNNESIDRNEWEDLQGKVSIPSASANIWSEEKKSWLRGDDAVFVLNQSPGDRETNDDDDDDGNKLNCLKSL